LITPETVGAALDAARGRIASAGRDPAEVRIVAVTKGQPAEAVAAALGAGVADIGENYAQELLAKAAEVSGPRWHFLGAVQRNKVRSLAPVVHLWQSVDRREEAAAITRAAPAAAMLVEVRLAGGPERGGCPPGEVEDLVTGLRLAGNRVDGLMAVGVPGPPDNSREGFRWLAGEARRLGLEEVSMGMTDDLEVAVAEGATMVRLGRALFGPRPGG